MEFDQNYICRCHCQCYPLPINKGCGCGCGIGQFNDGLRCGSVPYGNTQNGCANGFVSCDESGGQNGNGQHS